jgi:membrane-associated phospholipid phosphatase
VLYCFGIRAGSEENVLVELLRSIDKGAYYSFNDLVQKFATLRAFAQLGDLIGSYLGVGVLAILTLMLLLLQGRLRAVVVVLVVAAVGAASVEALRALIPAARPDAVAGAITSDELVRSFPSREVFSFTLVAALFLATAWVSLARSKTRWLLAGVVTIVILWVAISQLLLDLHFVSDVAAGLFGGLALALLAHRFFETPGVTQSALFSLGKPQGAARQ